MAVPGAGALGPAGPQGPPTGPTQFAGGIIPPWAQAPDESQAGVLPSWMHGIVDTSQMPAPATSAPAPTAAPPDPALIAPNVDYVSQFNASMGRQRQALDNVLASSLGALGARRDAAAKVVAGIPGQVQQTFQQAEGQQANVRGNADKATGAGAKGGSIGGDANAALYQNELTANEGAGKAVEPLLQLGASANYDLGAAGLQQQHLAGVSALDQQQQAFDMQMAQQQQQEQWQLAHTPPETFAQRQDLAGIDPSTGVPFSVEAKSGSTNPKTGLNADQTVRATQARDDQANRAGYSSYQGWQDANVKGPQLAKVLSDPARGSDALNIVAGRIQGNADLRHWFQVNAPGIYAQFQTMNGAKPNPANPKASANPAFP